MAWLPNERIGVVVLTNWGEYNPVPSIIERNIFDRLLGLELVDWNGRSKVKFAAIVKQFGMPPKTEPPPPPTTPSHPLADYPGIYTHSDYGVVTITVENGNLIARLDRLVEPIPLEHGRYNIFRPKLPQNTTLSRWASRRLTFYYDNNGKMNRLTIPMEGGVPDVVFKRTN